MITRKLSINNLIWVSISEYRWPLDIAETYFDMLGQDLNDISDENWNVNVEWKLVDSKEIEYDFNYNENYKQVQADTLGNEIIKTIPNFKEILEKYWITLQGRSIRQPREYNYEDDSLDMEFEFDEDEDWRQTHPELMPFVQNYIQNVRQKSRDGYISFEPDSIELVEINDYAYLYAILDKEGILDEVKRWIEDWIIEINETAFENLDDSWYIYNREKYHLSFDEGKLIKF